MKRPMLGSVSADARVADQLAPSRRLDGDEAHDLLRVQGFRLGAKLDQLVADVRQLDDLFDVRAELRNNGLGRLARRKQRVPGQGLETWKSELGNGGNIRNERAARRAG